MIQTVTEVDALKELVKKDRVRWEVWPECLMDPDGNRMQIGFAIDLLGIHKDESIHVDLKRIADYVTAIQTKESEFEVEVYDQASRFEPKRNYCEEAVLVIKILHNEIIDRPFDASEVKCVQDIEARLAELGARRGA